MRKDLMTEQNFDSKTIRYLYVSMIVAGLAFTGEFESRRSWDCTASLQCETYQGSNKLIQTVSGTNIYLCGHRYFQYPVVTDIYVSPSHHTSKNFPTLTICLNSMHADFKVKKFHDDDGKLSDSLRPVLAIWKFVYES